MSESINCHSSLWNLAEERSTLLPNNFHAPIPILFAYSWFFVCALNLRKHYWFLFEIVFCVMSYSLHNLSYPLNVVGVYPRRKPTMTFYDSRTNFGMVSWGISAAFLWLWLWWNADFLRFRRKFWNLRFLLYLVTIDTSMKVSECML